MNIAKLTEKYIIDHPHIRSTIKKGLINYSGLTRLIAKENNINIKDHFDAILIACRRYKEKIKKDNNQEEILDLLKKSKIEVKNKIAVIVLENSIPRQNLEKIEKDVRSENITFRLIESATVITVITGEDYIEKIEKTAKNNIIKITPGLVEVTLKTSKDIENIPGVMAFLYSLFAEYDINIIETMSCWTDTIFALQEKDLAKAMQVMRF